MNPSDEKDIVKYNTENPLDPDIISTQSHFKQQEQKQEHQFDPTKFLAQQQSGEEVQEETSSGRVAAPKPVPAVTSVAQQKSSTKNSVKQQGKSAAKTEAKVASKAQTKAEKMNAFVQMRKKMMSNWGTK